jgi:hypothetical protein
MNLDEHDVWELRKEEYNDMVFFDEYLSENRPVVLKDFAWEWNATRTWSNLTDFA